MQIITPDDMPVADFKRVFKRLKPDLTGQELFILYYRRKLPRHILEAESIGTKISYFTKIRAIRVRLFKEGKSIADIKKIYAGFLCK